MAFFSEQSCLNLDHERKRSVNVSSRSR
jgi:hypothetical protein